MKEKTPKPDKTSSTNTNPDKTFFNSSSTIFGEEVLQQKDAPFFQTNQSPPPTVQKQGAEEEELQMKEADSQKSSPSQNNTGLPNNLKTGVENLSGHSMDDVKVHRNSDKPAQLNALAYAQGSDIHLGPGQEEHLPHEAWHVAQQKQGRVKPTMQMKDKVNVNDDEGLEKEADEMGAKAMQANSVEPEKGRQKNSFANLASNTIIQRKIELREPEKTYKSVDTAIEDAKLTADQSIAKQHVKNIFRAPQTYSFKDQPTYIRRIKEFAEGWIASLQRLGVRKEQAANAIHMHKQLGNAMPQKDHAIFHKIAKPYNQLLGRWKAKIGRGEISNKGLEYRPWGGDHNMPLNYSWLASVAQHQVPVQVIVPITERVLIRPKTQTSTNTPVVTDMNAVRRDQSPAPLSATALELLGLLRNGFYKVDTGLKGNGMCVRLIPTGKIITDPTQIITKKTAVYSLLVKELGSYGIKIHENEIINQIVDDLPRIEEPQRKASTRSGENLGGMFKQKSQGELIFRRSLAMILVAFVFYGIVRMVQALIS